LIEIEDILQIWDEKCPGFSRILSVVREWCISIYIVSEKFQGCFGEDLFHH
jgi:hypothetical protein